MMTRPRVLVVGGDKEDRAFLRRAFEGAESTVVIFGSGSAALDALRDTPFDLVITTGELDDGLTGLRLARAVKWRWPETPVIILAEGQSFDAVRAALNVGVDACLLKPVDEAQVQEAVRQALEGRHGEGCVEEAPPVLRWRGLALYRQEGRISLGGERVHLTPIEFKLLRHLMENGHRVVSPEELFEISHSHAAQDRARADDVVRWHVHNLRQKIEPDPRRPTYILNVYGLGYTFAGLEA